MCGIWLFHVFKRVFKMATRWFIHHYTSAFQVHYYQNTCFLDVKMTHWHSCFWDVYIFYAHNMSINKTMFWQQICIICFFMLMLYVYLKKIKQHIHSNACHIKAVSHWLLISWSSAAVSEQVRKPFVLFVGKPSLWRTSYSVPSICSSWLKRVKLPWRLAIKPQKVKCTIHI